MRTTRLLPRIGLVLAALVLPSHSAAQHAYKLIDIGTLGGPSAHGPGIGPGSQLLNNSGAVAGTADTSTEDPGCGCFISHGLRWQHGVLSDLRALQGGEFTAANAINARGWVAGFSQITEIDPLMGGPAGHAVLWKDDAVLDLGTLGTGIESAAWYVKNGGQVVGNATMDTTSDPFGSNGIGPFASPTHVFIWKNGVIRDIGTLGGPDSFAAPGCNTQRDELVAGTSFINSSPNADTGLPTLDPFLWENGEVKDLGTLGGTYGFAQCANDRGQVIGQSSLEGGACFTGSGLCHAFFWDGASLKDLNPLGGSFSVASWLNQKGEAVGAATTTNDESFHAALWRGGAAPVDLGTLPGDCLSIAWGINNKSQIVGQSLNCDTGRLETVLWDNGLIVDLKLVSNDPLNINDQGEIAGVALPAGCDNLDSCGRAFLLVPCDDARTEGCEKKSAGTIGAAVAPSTNLTKQIVAAWRARLAQRYHIPGLRGPRN